MGSSEPVVRPMAMLERRPSMAFGAVNLLVAALVAIGVFRALPARWWPVDTVAAILIALLAVAGFGLIRRTPWATRVARVASFVVLGVGLVLVAVLALTASYLSAIYGPVGRGGALILSLVAALVLPYLVAVPAWQLVWLGAKRAP